MPEPPKVPIRRRVATLVLVATSIGCFAGALVRLTVRDRIPFVAVLHHATPNVLIAAFALACALAWRRRRQGRRAFALALLGALFAGRAFWLDVAREGPAPLATDVVRVATWNVARGHVASWDRLAQRAALLDADLLVVLEATDPEVQDPAFWKQRFPRHRVLVLGAAMVALVEGEARVTGEGNLRGGGRWRTLDVTLRGTRFGVLAADVASDPLLDRSQPILHVRYLAGHLPEGPRLVLGDFNTPSDSYWLDGLREAGWQDAARAAGRGWIATWPVPLPVLAIDQIWSSPEVRLVGAGAVTTLMSDHRAVVAEIELPR